MNNASWSAALGERFLLRTGVARAVRFPGPGELRIEGDRNAAEFYLSATAATSNMQADAAAFEAWALILIAWCDVERVVLDWTKPADPQLQSRRGHYQRFLYRVVRFSELMGERLEVRGLERLADLELRPDANPTLNAPGAGRAHEASAEPLTEHELEIALTHQGSPARERLARAFGLTAIERQLPVGVFAGPPTNGAEIFTGGKSAIDIVGLGVDGSFWIFELNRPGNTKVGALSELFFYSAVLRDVRLGTIRPSCSALRDRVTADDARVARRIRARILGSDLHPLLGDEVFALLNWHAGRCGWAVDYGKLDPSPFLSIAPQPVRPAGTGKRIYVPSEGPESWKALLAEPEKHGKPGFSAMAVASSWEAQHGLPAEIGDLFASSAAFGPDVPELLVAIPEHKVALPPAGGRESQNDVFTVLKAKGQTISMTVEAKVEEPFGETLGEWRKGQSRGKSERLAFMCRVLGLNVPPSDGIYYQLLHRTASSLIEAERLRTDAAAMIVQSFSRQSTWFDEYARFVALFGRTAERGSLVEVHLTGGRRVYLGWATARAASRAP